MKCRKISDSNETDPVINKENIELLRRPEVFDIRSRKVHDSFNSENRNRAHLWRIENWLGAGCSKFLARELPERARSTGAAVCGRKTHVPTNGPANVSSRKRMCHRNAFQCNSAVKTTLHHLKTVLGHCNSAKPMQ